MDALEDFNIDFITLPHGKKIGFRQIGTGLGLILVHGALQSSLSFTKMARVLAPYFTVYIPDRRGRGLSSGYGDNDDRITEANDMIALAHYTKTTKIFGLSSGAIITLQTALLEPTIKQIALFEPPIPLQEGTFKKLDLNYEAAMAKDNLGRAFHAILKGTGDDFFLHNYLPL